MKCVRCGHGNRLGARFCEECGSNLALLCASCGSPLSPTAKFCSECGHRATGTAAPPSSGYEELAFYTPRYLAEKILTSRASLEGERKQVTALFADLKGSTELFADRDPEEVRGLLDPVIEKMMEAIHRYEGTVNHVLGDGIVALFGAPLAHEDHAVRACYAALRMQETVSSYGESVCRERGLTVQIRVGLNSGEVVVRAIGNDLRMDYTVVGQTMNVAARMEQLARPGSILIAPDTMRLVEGFVRTKPLGSWAVKGLAAPLEVHELVAATTIRSCFQAASLRGLTPFVGRESDLAQLHLALDRAAAGRGQIVAIVGEAGVGKSRLCWEFRQSSQVKDWRILETGSVSFGRANKLSAYHNAA